MDNKPISKKKTIISVLFVIILSIVVFMVFLNYKDINEIIYALKNVNKKEIALAYISLLFYAITWPFSLCLLSKKQENRAHFLDYYLTGESEHFFNSITPFSTGGQPIQIYLLTKRNIKTSEATGLVGTNFIALLIASNIYAFISLFFYKSFSENFNSSTSWMIILGFTNNLLTLIFLILMMTSKFIRDLFKNILLSLCKIKLIGNKLTKLIPIFEQYCYNAQLSSKNIFSHLYTFILAILLRMFSLLFLYAIPFFILRALGINIGYHLLPLIILASNFAITTMVWVPTPGGTGGIEFAFTTIFTASVFGNICGSVGAAGMILWRALTYYILSIFNMLCYILYTTLTKFKTTKNAE